jgi:hypothetical protein
MVVGGIISNCTEYIFRLKPNSSVPYNVKYTWVFDLSLNISYNNFSTQPVVAEAGDLLLYSFNDSDGRIGIDATQGYYPDYNISNRKLIGNMSQLQRFSILLQTGPVQKAKQYPSVLSKYYDTPGTYTISSIHY